LHVGNARTALLNWLFARRYGGDFVLRIEDTDRQRTSGIYEKNVLEDLRWLKINWDEGPDKEGPFGPYRQSERLDLYEQFRGRLFAQGRVYPCYCSEDELEMERVRLLSRGIAPRYSGKCRNLTEEDRKKFEREGRAPAFRYRVEEEPIEFNDLIRGPMKFHARDIGDFIILRSSGVPAYNFAVVVDDHQMEISHVIRGEDNLSNTAMQLQLYKSLGFQPPLFAHHALVLGKDRSKLSKRHGSVAVREFREGGVLPEAFVNYLALMGSSYGEGREVMNVEEIAKAFSLDRVGKGGAVFDEDKLNWLNTVYIRKMDVKELTDRVIPFMKEAGLDAGLRSREWLEDIVEAVSGNLIRLSDVRHQADVFFDEHFRLSEEAASFLETKEARQVLIALKNSLADDRCPEHDVYAFAVNRIREQTGRKGKALFMPIRAAVTGRLEGPELEKLFSILGRRSLLKRADRALEAIGK
jgi:nondiscriminating glutamyl-tRNA synthetase